MKYKFDSTFIELGFIKELLKEFNLPNVPVATDDTRLYPGQLYVKDLGIYRCLKDGKLKKIADYYYNRPVFNLTRNMSVTTSYYSTDFHEYLGEYLRFLRDYKHLNLMSLYNCFSNRVIFPKYRDDNYNYYAIPVKFGQVYTIGFDSTSQIEVYCTLWNNVTIGTEASSNDTDSSNPQVDLRENTKLLVSGCKLNSPFIYTKLKDLDATKYLKNWNDLRLIIKMPQTNDTSITVLEGDYIFNSVIDSKLTTYTEFNNDLFDSEGNKYPYHNKTYPTDLSLLKINDKQKHPFADRLIEYLLDTAITHMDKLDENIKRTQNYLLHLTNTFPGNIAGIWNESINDTIYRTENYVINYVKDYKNNIVIPLQNLSQDDTDYLFYKVNMRSLIDMHSDMLTYVDKDVEELFLALGVDENEYMG